MRLRERFALTFFGFGDGLRRRSLLSVREETTGNWLPSFCSSIKAILRGLRRSGNGIALAGVDAFASLLSLALCVRRELTGDS